jgi:hypothetical protein
MYFGKYRNYIIKLASHFKLGSLKEAYGRFTGTRGDDQLSSLSNASL